MKKILFLTSVVVLVLAFGSAYGAGKADVQKDTFINYLDPSNAEVETGHMDAAVIGEAEGGIRADADTFLNYIDPSRMDANPAFPVRSGSLDREKGADTFLNDIAPPNAKDWGGGD